MINKFDNFVNEAVAKRFRYIEEGKEIIRDLLEEAYKKGKAYSAVNFMVRGDVEILFDEFFLMREIGSHKIYVKYKDSIMSVNYEIHRNYYTTVYKEMTVDEFKNMLKIRLEDLETTLKKLK
jgi:hypothetical protein